MYILHRYGSAELRRKDYTRFLKRYCHNINLVRFMVSRPIAIDYVNLKRSDSGVVVLNADGLLCVLELGQYNLNGWSEDMEIYFKDGHIEISPPPALLRNVSATIETMLAKTLIKQQFTAMIGRGHFDDKLKLSLTRYGQAAH